MISCEEKKITYRCIKAPKHGNHYIVFNLSDADLLGQSFRKAEEDSFFFDLLCEYRQREIFNLRKELEVGFCSPSPRTPLSDKGSKLSVFVKIKSLGYLEREWDAQQHVTKFGSGKKSIRRINRFNPAVTPPARQIRYFSPTN